MNIAPQPILDALPHDAEEQLDAHLTNASRMCEGAKHHSPTPLLVYPVGLPDGREVWLCGTCRGNAQVMQLMQISAPDGMPWRRYFGNKLLMLLPRTS